MDLNKIKLRAYVDYRVGNVIKIKGKFGFRVTVIFDDMEEKESQHSGFAKKEEAEKERNHVIAQLHDKKYVVYKNIKVEELLTYWLENIIRIAASLGHSKSIITFDVYTDKQALIEGGVEEIDAFIDEVHPYDSEDIQILKEKYGKKVLHRLA